MKKFNINNPILIQINDKGWAHLKKSVSEEYIKHCIKNHETTINGETWYKLQCHEVFNLLPTNNGFLSLFNTNILFEDEDLDEFKTE